MEAIEEYQTQSTIDIESPCVENSATPDVHTGETDFLRSNGVTEADDVAGSSAPIEQVAVEKALQLEGSVDVSEKVSEELPSGESTTGTEPQEHEILGEAILDTMPEHEFDIEETVIESEGDKVTFKTEVLVETNDSNEEVNQTEVVQENSNILSELGQSIELSEVLRSADTPEAIENNNSARQELFNKEELLDILEGNDIQNMSGSELGLDDREHLATRKMIESQIAMNQLTRLQKKKNKGVADKSKINKKKGRPANKPKVLNKPVEAVDENIDQNITVEEVVEEQMKTLEMSNDSNSQNTNDSLVNTLVKDWDDDEHMEDENVKSEKDCGDSIVELPAETSVSDKPSEVGQGDGDHTMETNSGGDGANLNKSEDETQPQKRQGRVIKKKVIFDPDNPDTFTKGKAIPKNKESVAEKEPSPKKIKTEEKQRSKSKSPASMTKLPWKKPPPKNMNKQYKRLSEVDKLLMDEGAVNMIYQLTPEAPKGRKNMRTKAEFIKKVQSSTPDGKEMKFRERKKEKAEEEAKKILGGKQRMSLSSSLKSPSMSEDFEAHCPDDSIIYRRHSSSSYSSSCMSPRRLSDVEASAVQAAARTPLQPAELLNVSDISPDQDFIENLANAPTSDFIKKEDCLSIKEKLNSKLSQVLNKRKRETSKEKISTKKRPVKGEKKLETYSYLTVSYDQSLAEICIHKNGFTATVNLLKELEQTLDTIDKKQDICVTLLTSETGSLCSGIAFRPLLDSNMEKRTNYAHEIAESARSMLTTLERHSKMVVTGVWAGCSDLALALVGLSDVAVCSEDATFSLSSGMWPPAPGVAVLTSRCGAISRTLVNELVVFKRQLSASEAQKGGLISRTVWPQHASEQVRSIARDIALQPVQSVLLKKQILNVGNQGDRQKQFQASLEAERDLLVQYWTSVECQDAMKTCCLSPTK